MPDLNKYTDSTVDIVLLVIFAIALLITVKVWLEKQAIRRGGRIPAPGGGLYPFLVVVCGILLLVLNR